MLRKVYMIERDRCAAVSPVIVADVFREALLRAHTVRFYIVDLGLRLCHDCAGPLCHAKETHTATPTLTTAHCVGQRGDGSR